MKKILSDITPLVVILIAVWVILLIPFNIMGLGFLPPDDASWHSSRAVSDKSGSDVLVLRDDVRIETHPGWHAILVSVRNMMNWNAHSLVLFSVILLFILFLAAPLFFFRYPESWLLSILAVSIVGPGWIFRLLLGRPYIVTMAVLLAIFLLWPRLKAKKIPYGTLVCLTLMIAFATWIHRTFYILFIPIAAFLLAREWRAAFYFTISLVLGVFIGASVGGHPVIFIKQTMLHLLLVSGSYENQGMLVSELRPALGDFGITILVSMMLFWRGARHKWNRSVIDNPIFILVVLSFIGGFLTRRVWLDVGMPVMILWMAKEFEEILTDKVKRDSPARILITAALAFTLYLSFTADADGRWSSCHPIDYLSDTDPEQKEWLPGPGGIIYSDDMNIFFTTVFKNPHGNWRYILGPEAAVMPEEDLAILRNIQKHPWTYEYFKPWVNKMRQEDRLIIRGSEDRKPRIEGLEWKYAAVGTWVGRKPPGEMITPEFER